MGFLKSRKIEVFQADLGIEVATRLFSQDGLRRVKEKVKEEVSKNPASPGSDSVLFFLDAFEDYLQTVEPVVQFLQGKDPTLAHRISRRTLLPEGPRFTHLSDDPEAMTWAFGQLGIQDQAKHLASLYIDDLADVIQQGVDPRFGLSRYGEKLASSQPSFDPLTQALSGPFSLIDELLKEALVPLLEKHQPNLIAFSVPFPGNVFGAFRCAEFAKKFNPEIKTVMGGGYVNTELRELSDPRVFKWMDYVTLDDGEIPLLRIIERLEKGSSHLVRTFYLKNGEVQFQEGASLPIPQEELGNPTTEGLPLQNYISLLESPNPMHRLWSDLRWNKLLLAHGCYWKKCAFCDTSLDYIGRYEPIAIDCVIDRMVRLIQETGQRGFHFIDEAAPPALLRQLSRRLKERKVTATWWGNVRFDKAFTPELAQEMADAGCVAVSGGLECASDRLLALMQKGVSVEQVARVTHGFQQAGILVHAYLMYGFPSQTAQETVDSLEQVRQLFEAGSIQSAYWHRFSLTVHSPIWKNLNLFGITAKPPAFLGFSKNDVPFHDPVPADHSMLGAGVAKATFNYMRGVGILDDVRQWFPKKVPKTTVHPRFIENAIQVYKPNR